MVTERTTDKLLDANPRRGKTYRFQIDDDTWRVLGKVPAGAAAARSRRPCAYGSKVGAVVTRCG
jgi:hypothetical protein